MGRNRRQDHADLPTRGEAAGYSLRVSASHADAPAYGVVTALVPIRFGDAKGVGRERANYL